MLRDRNKSVHKQNFCVHPPPPSCPRVPLIANKLTCRCDLARRNEHHQREREREKSLLSSFRSPFFTDAACSHICKWWIAPFPHSPHLLPGLSIASSRDSFYMLLLGFVSFLSARFQKSGYAIRLVAARHQHQVTCGGEIARLICVAAAYRSCAIKYESG